MSSSAVKGNRYSTENRAAYAAKKQSATIKCRVCFDAGKSIDMYTSHRVKEMVGGRTIICPTLMTTECQQCHRTGHTVSHCPEKKNQMAHSHSVSTEPIVDKKVKTAKTTKTVATPISSNGKSMFSALADSSDSDSDCDSEEENEPIISDMKVAMKATAGRTTTSWYDSDDE